MDVCAQTLCAFDGRILSGRRGGKLDMADGRTDGLCGGTMNEGMSIERNGIIIVVELKW